MEKGVGDEQRKQPQSGVPLDWAYANQADSFRTSLWDQPSFSHLNFYELNSPRPDICWNPTFIDVASLAGHFPMINKPFDPYSIPHPPAAISGADGGSDPLKFKSVAISGGEAFKKRKMSAQETGKRAQLEEKGVETAKEGDEPMLTAQQESSNLNPAKVNAKQTADPAKEDYIHVRARRGQATNSHSLAERLRREKISERMKLLQDLVPGCSKVTGKAVMLDEIINYVQSLQRQVEFLSMKLAAAHPHFDFNIEGLVSKQMQNTYAGPSSTTNDIVHPLLHQNLQDLVHSGAFGVSHLPLPLVKESKPLVSEALISPGRSSPNHLHYNYPGTL